MLFQVNSNVHVVLDVVLRTEKPRKNVKAKQRTGADLGGGPRRPRAPLSVRRRFFFCQNIQ